MATTDADALDEWRFPWSPEVREEQRLAVARDALVCGGSCALILPYFRPGCL
ncbi:MAG: hypothetical protein ACRDWI_14355 [Jiangellaceae bacterium]